MKHYQLRCLTCDVEIGTCDSSFLLIGAGLPQVQSQHFQRSPGCDHLRITAEELPPDLHRSTAALSGPLLHKERLRRQSKG